MQVPAEVRWAAGEDVQALWLAAGRLLLDRHAWVRRAAGRLLGAAFADAQIGVCPESFIQTSSCDPRLDFYTDLGFDRVLRRLHREGCA